MFQRNARSARRTGIPVMVDRWDRLAIIGFGLIIAAFVLALVALFAA